MKSFEKVCDLVTAVIEANYPERQDNYPQMVEALSTELKDNSWAPDEVLALAHDAFKTDIQLYLLFLSSVYLASLNPDYLVRIEALLMADVLDIPMTSALYLQTKYYRFTYSINDDYPFVRELNRHISQRYFRELGITMDPIPYEQRNHDLVFVVTYQLLEERHAPSRIVMSLCWYLQKYFGYQVQLLIMAEPVDVNTTSAFWAGDIIMPNYMPTWGDNVLNYKGENIYYYQIDLHHTSKEKMLDVIGKLYYKKPEFILQFGGLPLTDQLWRSMSTFIAIPAGNNYEASDAQLLVSYQQSKPEAIEAYLDKIGQKHLQIKLRTLPLTENAAETEYTKKAFGIPEDSFAIAIVGNRLDDEISTEFQDLLMRILDADEKVSFVIIGNYELPLPEKIDNRTIRLGYRQDFAQTISITDLFLNPKRSGGAGGALRSLNLGIPVITLPSCDVAAFVGDDFICNSYEEMGELVHKYVNNSKFYKSQSEKAKKHNKDNNATFDIKEELQKMIDAAVEIAKNNN